MAQNKAPLNSSLVKWKILSLTTKNVDKNATKNLYALNVNGGASLSASSVITKVAPHTSVVNTSPILAKVVLLIFSTSINCGNA